MAQRVGYPSAVRADEWVFAVPDLALVREDASRWQHPLRSLFNAVRYVAKTGVGKFNLLKGLHLVFSKDEYVQCLISVRSPVGRLVPGRKAGST
jgi:hypothetical protein